ncbi:hypothetical protein Q7P35_001185 [Cladosporium inversicolor]
MSQQQQQQQQANTVGSKDIDIDYLAINRARWDERAPHHATSPDYHVASLISTPSLLSRVVQFDTPRLPSLTNKKVVHLQCHIGTDTLSLARLGASHVAGLDLSPASLLEARKLASATAGSGGEKLKFVEGDVYSAPNLLGEGEWDVVFTGIGSLGWLPSIKRWAETVSALLRVGGVLFIREGHPVLFAVGDADASRLVVEYPYFETAEAIVSEEPSTYVRLEMEGKKFEARKTVEWNHGLGEIVGALLAVGMRVVMLEEHRSVPWNALPGQMVCIGDGEWALETGRDRLPLSYTLRAVKE